MRKFSILAALALVLSMLCGAAAAEGSSGKTVTDMAGRTVTVPETIETLCATGQPGAVLLYTLCADKLVAWNSAMPEECLPYLPETLRALPVIGSMQGGKPAANPEEVLALRPDVIVYMTTLTKQTAGKADEIQARTGIPVITVSFDLVSIGDSYRFLGGVLGCGEKAETLARFCDALIADVREKAASIAPEDRVTYYYAAAGGGLQTAPAGTNHTEIYELAGGVNVVDLPAETNGRLTVDMERILAWQPDVVIAATPELLSDVETWEYVGAVTDGRVFSAPTAPFPWLDAPVSVNRLIGLCWAAETLYPDVYAYDLEAYAQTFYSLFYGYTLSSGEAAAMIP